MGFNLVDSSVTKTHPDHILIWLQVDIKLTKKIRCLPNFGETPNDSLAFKLLTKIWWIMLFENEV